MPIPKDTHRAGDCRHATLHYLCDRQGLTVGLGNISLGLSRDGYDFGDAEIIAALSYLAGDKLITVSSGQLSASKLYQITTDGIRFVERGGR